MLANLTCGTIDKTTPPLTPAEVKKMSVEIPGWSLGDSVITREFSFKDFDEAMKFVNRIAGLAADQDHHPDIHVSYNKVKLELSTHKIHG
jgi:4a-hydroxytetrahydrobiopterin dehydratase